MPYHFEVLLAHAPERAIIQNISLESQIEFGRASYDIGQINFNQIDLAKISPLNLCDPRRELKKHN
jgi:hypothetical protein